MTQTNHALKRSTLFTLIAAAAVAVVAIPALRNGSNSEVSHAPNYPAPRVIASTNSENLPGLREQDEMMANLAEFVSPGVVHITSTSKSKGFDVLGNRLPSTGGQGSGVIFRPDGYIITNDHVVGGYEKVVVILQDGRELEGKVIRAEDLDIAVIKVEAKDLPTLAFGDSDKVRPGQTAMAVGSPFGLENTVTIGHISALGRTSSIADSRAGRNRFYPSLLQTDTPINMGNSGGPLVNIEGKVIGINSAIFSPTGMSTGIGFAIPSNAARLVAEKLIEDGKLERGALGLKPISLKAYRARELGVDGGAVVVEAPINGWPAANAGIKEGDILLKVGTFPIKAANDVHMAMLRYEPGDKVAIEVLRDKQRKTFDVTLRDAAKLPQQAIRTPEPPEKSEPDSGMPDLDDLRKRFFGKKGDTVPPLREGRPRLGVTVEDLTDTLRKQFEVPKGVNGAAVTSVLPGSVADTLGLQPGDIIESLGDRPIATAEDVIAAMRGAEWGSQIRIKFSRFSKGTSQSITRDIEFE